MYATTFTDNSVLRVDISKFDLTSEWLTKHGVKFEVLCYYGSFHSFARFDFINAPQSVIDAHNAKFNPQPVVEDEFDFQEFVDTLDSEPLISEQVLIDHQTTSPRLRW